MHAVLFLILAFFNAAGLFVLLGAEFLAMILVVVYVGAVAVLFLFVVMMLDVDFAELRAGFIRNAPLGAHRRRHRAGRARCAGSSRAASCAGALATLPRRSRRRLGHHQHRGARAACSTRKYVYSSRLPGSILLVAMIGAIVLTLRHKAGVKRQSIAAQVARDARDGGGGGQGRAGSDRHAAEGGCCTGNARITEQRQDVGGKQAMTIGLGHYLTVAACLFTLGIFGIFLNRKNVIVILMSVELMLLAVNINLVAFSLPSWAISSGQVFALFVLTVAAGRSSHRPRDRRRLLPQPRLDRGRRHQHDEGLMRR